ncbi:MAG: glycosyltransferase family 4 protein [Planctomycetes bacterium]|nr:glycosyltransferase family 4 protein [Planctomycetota bacterium]
MVSGWLLGAPSGANRRLLSLLEEAGTWLAPDERITVLHRPMFAPPRFDRIEWRAIDLPDGPTLRRAWAERLAVRPRLRELAATVYDHGLLPPPRVDAPLCLTIHDVRAVDGESRWPRLLARRAVRAAVRRAAAVVTVSEWTAARLRALAPGCAPVVVANGVRARERGALPRPQPANGYVLHVGHLEPRKNLPLVVEALARIEPSQRPELWLIGRDAGEWPRLRALGERRGVAANVHHLGVVPDRDLPAYYADARLLVMPSRYEGFGLPVLEARAHGTRVAVADATALPEVVGDGALLPLDAPDAWARAIAADPRERPEVVRRRAAEAGRCTWARAAQSWLEVLRRCSAASASRP